MRSALRRLATEPCRVEPVEFGEALAFSEEYTDLKRGHPGLSNFEEADSPDAAAPSAARVVRWISRTGERRWNAEVASDASGTDASAAEVFVKAAPILNPIGFLRGDYVAPTQALLPLMDDRWRTTFGRLHSRNNQAYVDSVAAFVLSRFRELDMMPHFPLFYGSAVAIAKAYKYNLTDEFESYRQCRWFWRGVRDRGIKLEMEPADDPDLIECVMSCPFEDDELGDADTDSDVESELSSIHVGEEGIAAGDLGEVGDLESVGEFEDLQPMLDDAEDATTDTTSSGEEIDYTMTATIPGLPVTLIYQEAHRGTMDDLLDLDAIGGVKRGTKAWDSLWLAWLWQVVAALTFVQRHIDFTHNDLHTNNIMWRETKEKYIWYRAHDGTTWRVPTHGKIFAIIDYGRAIFRIHNKHWLSDEFLRSEDAGGQYNYGPIYDKTRPKVMPNRSFDLCRLAISVLDGLYPDELPDEVEEGKPMSGDDDWIMRETKSALCNLLWSWTVDDAGKTVYTDAEGEYAHPGFDLYIHIAAHCHAAIPVEQLRKPAFDRFKTDERPEKGARVYML